MSRLTLAHPAYSAAVLPAASPAPRAFPAASLFLLLATLAYLCVEVPFAARLVSVLASDPSGEAVHAMERTGRLVSGMALALAAWGYVLRPRKPGAARKPLATLALLAATAAASLALMGYGQRSLIDTLADSSSASLRASALSATVAHGSGPARKPEAGTAMSAAALPLAAASASPLAGIRDRSGAVTRHAATLLPTATEFRGRAYVPAIDGVRRSYARYREGVSQLAGVDARAAREAEKSYRELWDTLREKRVTAIGFAVVNLTIAREVQERGIPVPTRWDPRDRATFDAAVLERARKRGDDEYRRAVEDALGTGVRLPPSLATFDAFLASAPVQARLRRELELPADGPALRAAPTAAEFEASVMAPLRRETASLLSRALSGDASALEGRLATPAREAVRTTLAVGIALVLSALGAIGHLAKAVNHLAAVTGAPGWARTAATAALLGGLVAVSQSHSAPVGTGGSAWGTPVAWSVGAHARISPLGDAMAPLPGLDAVARVADRMPWR